MSTDNTTPTTTNNRFNSETSHRISTISSSMQVKYARLQGYLEGYLDQLSSSKDAQEELISKLLSEIADMLSPLSPNNEE